MIVLTRIRMCLLVRSKLSCWIMRRYMRMYRTSRDEGFFPWGARVLRGHRVVRPMEGGLVMIERLIYDVIFKDFPIPTEARFL